MFAAAFSEEDLASAGKDGKVGFLVVIQRNLVNGKKRLQKEQIKENIHLSVYCRCRFLAVAFVRNR